MAMDFASYLKERSRLVDTWLDELVRPSAEDPPELWEAMRYSLLGGGKRLRPVLMTAVGETYGRKPEIYRYVASALECIHTYSLIHDDLPSMDNDTLRRGRPTCHVRFGEALAILAGDALLTLAFELLGRCPYLQEHPQKGLHMVKILATNAGASGMVGGQVLDLLWEGRPVMEAEVQTIHQRKTAALIEAAVKMGALMADVDDSDYHALSTYGQEIGLSFQIRDDILDATLPSEQLGKTAGKDKAQNKATYPRAVGLEAARQGMKNHLEKARESVRSLDRYGLLTGLVDYLGTLRA